MNALAIFSSNWITKLKSLIGLNTVEAEYNLESHPQDYTVPGPARIQFNNRVTDTHNAVTTGASWVWTCPPNEGGLYSINMKIQIDDFSVGFSAYHYAEIFVNNIKRISDIDGWVSGTPFPSLQVNDEFQMQPGDTIYVQGGQSSGPVRHLQTDSHATYIRIKKIRGL